MFLKDYKEMAQVVYLTPRIWCLLKKMPLLLLNIEGRVRETFLDLLFKLKNTFPKLTFDWMQFIQMSVPSDFG